MTATKKTLSDTLLKNLKYSQMRSLSQTVTGYLFLHRKKRKYGFIAISAPKQASEAQKIESVAIRK